MTGSRRAADVGVRVVPCAALLTLGGWAVCAVQGALTYNRLMVASAARSPTSLEQVLLVVGVLLAVAATVGPGAVRRQGRSPLPGPNPTTTGRLAAACAVLLAWYGLAVAQWHLVLAQASSEPGAFRRDPTLLEHGVLGCACAVGAVLVGRAVLAWRPG